MPPPDSSDPKDDPPVIEGILLPRDDRGPGSGGAATPGGPGSSGDPSRDPHTIYIGGAPDPRSAAAARREARRNARMAGGNPFGFGGFGGQGPVFVSSSCPFGCTCACLVALAVLLLPLLIFGSIAEHIWWFITGR